MKLTNHKNPIKLVFAFAFTLLIFIPSIAQQIQTVKLYPNSIRIEKGKSTTVTAVAFDSNGNYVPHLDYSFTSNNNNIVTATKARRGTISNGVSHFSKNLAEIRTASSSGNTTVFATINGVNSNSINVLVDDPTATPTAIIHGDNDASGGTTITTKVGEPIEVDAESSIGVKTIEWEWGDGDKTTDLLSSTHAYLEAGTYTLKLTIKNSSGSTSTSNLTVNVQDHITCDTSNTINVTTIAQLQTEYDNLSSAGGKCILIPPGVYEGNLVLNPKNFSDYVTIGTNATLPNLKDRITPQDSSLVTIRSQSRLTVNDPFPLIINNGAVGNKAGKLRFTGIKFEPDDDDWTTTIDAYYIVQVGNFTQTIAEHNPEKVIFEHCVLDPPDNIEIAHGLLNNGYKVSIISSWLGNIKTRDAGDSNAIFGFTGRGAHVYNNNFIEAGSENILYGGTGCNTDGCIIDGVVPTNIELRRSFLTKRLSWRTDYNYGEISVKNLFETKTGRRIYAEGNIFKNHWDDFESQGHALVFKSAVGNGSGGPLWNVTEDVVFENNRVSHIQGGIATTANNVDGPELSDYDARNLNNLKFKNMIFDDSSAERFGAPNGNAWFLFPNDVEDLVLDHITVIDPRDNITSNGERALDTETINNYRFTVTNSIIPLNEYGIRNTCGNGTTALDAMTGGGVSDPCVISYTGSWVMEDNILPEIGTNSSSYPINNDYPTDYSTVGLANYIECPSNTESCEQPITNFECVSGLCEGNASDQKDIGADIPLIAQQTACTESGIGTTCSTPPTGGGTVVWNDIESTTSNGGSVSHAGTSYYGRANSQQTITNGDYFEWTHTGDPDVWIGIIANGTASSSTVEASLPFSFSGGTVREFGVYKDEASSVSVGDVFRIAIDSSGTVTYLQNGNLVYTSQTSASGSYQLFFMVQEFAGNGINNAAVSDGGSSSAQSPYPGPNAPNLPTTIEIENFDNGGAGVAYSENFGSTGSSVYRSNPVEDVDIQVRSTASNGHVVFESSAGEWFEYTINVASSGTYDIGIDYASQFNNGKFHVEIDGVDVTGQLTANSTGNWGVFQTLTTTGVSISSGQHIVRLVMDTNSSDGCSCVVGNFDKIDFQTSSVGGGAVVWQNIESTTSNGGSVSHAGTSYYGRANSQQTITNGDYFEWTHTGDPDVWIGIIANGTASSSTVEASLPFSFSGGTVREFGVYKDEASSVSVGDVFRIAIDSSGTVTYLQNGNLVYTSQTSASGSYQLFFMVQEFAGNGIDNATVSN